MQFNKCGTKTKRKTNRPISSDHSLCGNVCRHWLIKTVHTSKHVTNVQHSIALCTAIMEPATTHRTTAPHHIDLLIHWVTVNNSTCLTGVTVIAERVRVFFFFFFFFISCLMSSGFIVRFCLGDRPFTLLTRSNWRLFLDLSCTSSTFCLTFHYRSVL